MTPQTVVVSLILTKVKLKFTRKTIVEEVDDYKVEITLAEAIEKEPEAIDLELGDPFVEVIDPRVFGRRLVLQQNSFRAKTS